MVYFDRESKQPPEQKCKQNEDNNNTALLIEFIDSCNSTTCLKRMDSNGHWWAQVSLDYSDDKTLHSKLEKIKQEYKRDTITVILDKTESYMGVEKVNTTPGQGYNKYTYIFSSANTPNLLFERAQLLDGPLGKLGTKAKHVEVYYLKASGKEDKEPFLIVFDPDGESKKEKNECYHFIGNYKFKDWVKFKCTEDGKAIEDEKELVKKLYERVNKIDTSEPKEPKPEQTPVPTKPKPFDPPPKEETLPIWLIVGCVAAGVVLIVTLVVVYGIYWYNTTIKLLT
nr:hypothetical protein MACL_00001721 [Theileria orientalis]